MITEKVKGHQIAKYKTISFLPHIILITCNMQSVSFYREREGHLPWQETEETIYAQDIKSF